MTETKPIDFDAVGQQVAAGLKKLTETYPDMQVAVWVVRDCPLEWDSGQNGIRFIATCQTPSDGLETQSHAVCEDAVQKLIALIGPDGRQQRIEKRKSELLAELAELEKEGK